MNYLIIYYKKLDKLALLVADPSDGTPPKGKINQLKIHYFTFMGFLSFRMRRVEM